MRAEGLRSDIDKLHEEFPAWRFGSVWASAASGPDARRLYAAKDVRLITAWTAPALAASIRREEAAPPADQPRPIP